MDRVVVNCPNCSLGHRLPAASEGEVTCQKCGERFHADTRQSDGAKEADHETAHQDPNRVLAKAEAGDAEACYDAGGGYTHGQIGFPKNLDLGRKWLMRATELSPYYQSNVAMLIMTGSDPFEKDEQLALSMLRDAMQRGDEYGRLELAIYMRDRDTLVELATSKQYYRYRLSAAFALLGKEAGEYNHWAALDCKDPVERKKLLLRRLDPKSSQGLFRWTPPWLQS
jgi:hypothetical protein